MDHWILRPAVPADFPRLVQVLNLTEAHRITLAEFRRRDRERDPQLPFLRLVVREPGARVAGFGVVARSPWAPAGVLAFRVAVDPALAGRGAGSALARALEEQARGWGAGRLDASVRDDQPAARAWMERRGFTLAYHEYESELDLGAFDPAPFQAAVAAARQQGYQFITMDVPGEGARRRLWELDLDTARDAPSAGTADWPFDVYSRHVFAVPDYDPAGIHLAVQDGEFVGVSGLHFPPDRDAAWSIFTGVRRAHRGRGLAMALKILALAYAQQKGYRRVGTGNHSLNAPMLAINRRLGFRPLPGEWRMRKPL